MSLNPEDRPDIGEICSIARGKRSVTQEAYLRDKKSAALSSQQVNLHDEAESKEDAEEKDDARRVDVVVELDQRRVYDPTRNIDRTNNHRNILD